MARAQTLPDVTGQLWRYTTRAADTFVDIARWYNLGFVELRAANPAVDPWLPGDGTELILPTVHLLPDAPRRGITVNLGDQRIYRYDDDGAVAATYAIGIGQEGWGTPNGSTRITRLRRDPVWIPPASIRAEQPDLPAVVPAGPDNPMGAFAIDLGFTSGAYRIHGTNQPYAVGRRVSHGCIRLYPEGIAELFEAVKVGTPVTVVDQRAKVGMHGGRLYLETHMADAALDAMEEGRVPDPEPMPEAFERVAAASARYGIEISWPRVEETILRRSGMPVVVGA